MEDPSQNPNPNPNPPVASSEAVAQAANPTPIRSSAYNHPPYAEMITSAILGLKNSKGSSKTAIEKYIMCEYGNLPPTHSALLAHHLKRLKKSGQLIMVKHSYKLPKSTAVLASTNGAETAVWAGNAPATAVASSMNGSKRGRGRPPKPKVNPEVQGQPSGGNVSELVLDAAPLGGQPTPNRGPGRPPKSKLPSEPSKQKKRPGRPRKDGSTGSGAERVTRPRGRPKKGALVLMRSFVKARGRPRKKNPLMVAFTDEGGGAGGVLPTKRVGRPPKVAGPKKPRKLTGTPLGRPRKQSVIQLAISLIKPHLNEQTPVDIVKAVELLEGSVKPNN